MRCYSNPHAGCDQQQYLFWEKIKGELKLQKKRKLDGAYNGQGYCENPLRSHLYH
jgi:hypothetical protein